MGLTISDIFRSTIILFGTSMIIDGANVQSGEEDRPSAPPVVGEMAKDLELASIDGEQVKLSQLTKQGPVVLVVLRGFPGYQCPICNAQVGAFLGRAKDLQAAGARVVLVYPGPSKGLQNHATEFIRGKTLPDNFYLLLDPDYKFTSAYRLRWNAPKETAYPSTFVIDSQNRIVFAHVSKTHGDRAKVAAVLETLDKK